MAPDRETGKITKKMALENFRAVININLTGVFLTVRECAERMINHGCPGLICFFPPPVPGHRRPDQLRLHQSSHECNAQSDYGGTFPTRVGRKNPFVAIAPGYVGTPMVKGMNQKALENILGQVPIGRFIEPAEVASLIGELYRNEALAGDTFFIHGGLRLGSKG